MFGSWPAWSASGSAEPASAGSGVASVSDASQRSRSPSRIPIRHRLEGEPGATALTDNSGINEWFAENCQDEEIYAGLLAIPLWRRKKILLETMDKTPAPQNVTSWLAVCVRNANLKSIENRLTRSASVHKGRSGVSGLPPMRDSGPPLGPGANAMSTPPGRTNSARSPSGTNPSPSTSGQMSPAYDPRNMPDWVRDALQKWPEEKGEMVAMVQANVSADVADLMGDLDVPAQVALCLGGLLAAPSEKRLFNDMIGACLKRASAVGLRSQVASSSTDGHSGGAQAMAVQLVLAGWHHAPLVVLAALLPDLLAREFADISLEFKGPLLIPTLPHKEGDIEFLEKKAKAKASNPEVRTMEQLAMYMRSEAAAFKTAGTKVLLVGIVDPTACLLPGVLDAPGELLHRASFSWLYDISRISSALRSTLGHSAVADAVFAPASLPEQSQQVFSELFGQAVPAPENPNFADVSELPVMFCTPAVDSWLKVIQDPVARPTIDGWTCPEESALLELPRGAAVQMLKSRVVSLFKERNLSPQETTGINTFTVKHGQTGEERGCSRDFFYFRYVVDETPIAMYFKRQLPCKEKITAVTGQESTGRHATACGSVRYCVHCEEVIRTLASGYQFHSLVNGILSVVVKATVLWQANTDDHAWTRAVRADRDHQCGAACPNRRT